MTLHALLMKSLQSPLFIDRDHLAASHPGRDPEALVAALLDPANPTPPNPNPIFDVKFYARVAGLAGGQRINPVHHYLTTGQFSDLSPNRFFDPDYFRSHNRGARQAGVSDVEAALARMTAGLLRVHPMLDIRMMAQDLGRKPDRALLADLFRDGLGRVDPNPLFDIDHYEAATGRAFATLGAALDHYYSPQRSEDTSVLFDADFYLAELAKAAAEDRPVPERRFLHHYLAGEATVDVHPMLHGGNYRGAVRRLTGEVVARPMEHYIRIGEAMGIAPGPFFDVSHYAAASGESRNLLKHYLKDGYLTHLAHPALDDLGARISGPPALEMARAQRAGRPFSVPIVDPARYLRLFPAVENSKENPGLHYLRVGFREAFSPNGLISVPYVATSERRRALTGKEAVVGYVERGMQRRRRVLIVLRDLDDRVVTQSWLAVLETQSGQSDTEFLVLTEGVGALFDRFRLVAHVMAIGDGKTPLDDAAMANQVGRFLQLLTPNPPELAIIEFGKETRPAHLIANAGIPIVTLADRSASALEPRRLLALLNRSERVLASTAATQDWLVADLGLPAERISLGATFVPSSPGRGRLRRRRALLAELGLPASAFVVAGVGDLTFERGMDRFGLLAKILSDMVPDAPLHFIWAGEGQTWPDTPYFYALHHMRLAGRLQQMHLLPAARQHELRAAADLFVIAEAEGVDVFEARMQESPTVIIGRNGFDPELADLGPVFDPVDLTAAADTIRRHITGEHRLRDGDTRASDIGGVIRALNAAIAATGLPVPRFVETAVRHASVAILLDRPENLALIARYPDPVDLYVIIAETGDMPAEVLARLPEGKLAILSGAGQGDAAAEALMRLALRNYPADRLCVVGVKTMQPTLDVSAPGRVTTWLLPGHPGDEAAVAALGDAFDRVLVARGDDLVAALRADVEETA
jgi:hypothetical protein